ncbi:septum formation initiator family protein [Dietzia aurantiaca]|uniref:FtsB family cell division protein n=1 Tax=Dietzia aurantiaca TaxID=983873 RepID=UPI001E3211BD|nr:septum formation initiator family protein [Dietzia aurantiaca]MCD2262888.1 septum formation initiator family protein [Dietzia aurantiaca]
MARPPRPSDRRGDGRERASSRRPGEASGPIRRRSSDRRGTDRTTGSGSSTAGDAEAGPASGADLTRRSAPQRRTPSRERDRPVPASARSSRVGTTAHPEAHRLTTRTDLSSTVLGPKNYTPRRIGLLAVVAIILLITVSFPLRNHYQFLRDEKAVMQERAAIEATIAELEAEQEMLSDPAFIEQQARIRFGAVKPGETPYRVSTVDPVEEAAAEKRAAEIAALPWQTRLWNSISVPADPVMPEESILDGTSIPGGPDTPPTPVMPHPDGVTDPAQQNPGQPDAAEPGAEPAP